MVEFNYCPQCATAKIGRFCAGCGVNLEDLESLFRAPQGEPRVVEPESVAPPEPELAPAVQDQLGLVYGDAFNPETDCGNCGSPGPESDCVLCGAE